MKAASFAASAAIAFAGVICAAPMAHAAVVSFENATDLTGLFTPNATINSAVTFNASAGVGGSGGLSVTGDGRVFSYNAESFDLSTGATLTVSLDAKESTSTDTGIANRVALVGSVGDGLGPPNFPNSFYADYNDTNLRIILNAGNGTTPTAVPVTLLQDGNWNRLVMTVQDLGASLAVEARLYDIGPTGTSTPDLRGTISATYTGALATDTSVYAAFKVGNSGTVRATAADNFVAAIPEPASLSLLGLAGLGALRRRRD